MFIISSHKMLQRSSPIFCSGKKAAKKFCRFFAAAKYFLLRQNILPLGGMIFAVGGQDPSAPLSRFFQRPQAQMSVFFQKLDLPRLSRRTEL